MAPDPATAAALFAGSLIASWAATGLILPLLRRARILDHPNHRSSHERATPRGGGLPVVAVLIVVWAVLAARAGTAGKDEWVVLAAATGLAVLSWADDLRGLPALPRFAAQAIAVGAGAALLTGRGLVFQGLVPPVIDAAMAAFAWLWFVNLFNFMDGIDGITGVETASIGLGLFLVAAIAGDSIMTAGPALAAAGAAIGFLWWNWQPARVFLGDVGSVPLGYLLGWLLLSAATAGHWQAALILPLYYLADATITLLRRLWRGERIWQAHREHFYQQACRRGLSHAAVVVRILLANTALVALAAATGYGSGSAASWAVAVATLVVAVLLLHLAGIVASERRA